MIRRNGVVLPKSTWFDLRWHPYQICIRHELRGDFAPKCVFSRWWAQDGPPAHQLITLLNRLLDSFQQHFIAFDLLVECPPRSPDLTSCDYFPWGYLKDKVYQTPPKEERPAREDKK